MQIRPAELNVAHTHIAPRLINFQDAYFLFFLFFFFGETG